MSGNRNSRRGRTPSLSSSSQILLRVGRSLRRMICGVCISFSALTPPSLYYYSNSGLELDALSISLDHQRKGIGFRLMEEWLKIVDADGRPLYILSSVKGKGLYEKMGAKEVGFVETDLKDFGLEKPYPNFTMIREGRKSEVTRST